MYAIRSYYVSSSVNQLRDLARTGIRQVYQRGYLDREKSSFAQKVLAIRADNTTELRRQVKDFYDRIDVAALLQETFVTGLNRDSSRVDFMFNLVYPLLQPNVRYNHSYNFV